MHAGHDLVGSIAWNEEALDSAAAYCRVPLSSSVDLASHTRQDGIQYRAGIYQVQLQAAPTANGPMFLLKSWAGFSCGLPGRPPTAALKMT